MFGSSNDGSAYIESVDAKSTLTRTDGWSLRPAVVSLTVVAILTLLCQLPGSVSFVLIPLSLLGYGVAAAVVLVITGYCLIKKRPRRGGSTLFVLLLPVLLWRPTNWAADIAHLGLTAGFGVGQLGSSPRSNDDSFVVYDWSVGLVGGPNTFLIHDVSDEIALPMAQHTHPPSSESGWGEECAGKVRRLMNHYYVCTI
jgi:hypothetical protein